jgi:hypothetical protein
LQHQAFSDPSQTAKVALKQPKTTLQKPLWFKVGSGKLIIQPVTLNVIKVIAIIIMRGIIRNDKNRSTVISGIFEAL